jgi:uncharacterized membrane protein
MKRIHIFIIVLAITLAVLLTLAFVAWYLATSDPAYYGSSWMSQMWGNHLGATGNYGGMGGMMGGGTGTTTSYLWIIPVILAAVVAAAIIGVSFYLFFPELKFIRATSSCSPQNPQNIPNQINAAETAPATSPAVATDQNLPNVSAVSNNCEVLLKTMTPEEQKVLNVLIAHQGKYLQKYVVKEAGLSRLKTHRVVARFAQRGIVTVKEFGNTNEILLSDWVKSSSIPKEMAL